MTSLETRDLTIRFGGHVAVDAVSCMFRPGELTAIVGPNGAGKTTYFNLISGQLAASAGEVLLDGRDITREPAPARTRAGIGRAFQLTNLFPRPEVTENVRLAIQSAAGVHYDMLRPWMRHTELIARADAVLERVALAPPARRAGGRALAWRPAQARSRADDRARAEDLHVRRADRRHERRRGAGRARPDRAAQAGHSKIILLVEHKMDVVRSLADRIIVLHNGKLVADGKPAEVMASPVVQEAYLGSFGEKAA